MDAHAVSELSPHISVPASPPFSASTPYLVVLGCFLVLIVCADRMSRKKAPKTIVTREFKTFQHNYLRVYLCALAAEWLQDSHLFALLLRHGYSIPAVSSLFSVGLVVSYVWGLLAEAIPGVASLGNRRQGCLLSFGLYAGSAFAALHSNDYATLLLGRVMYGTGTALLHTIFDAWMHAEHTAKAFPDEWLLETYRQVSQWTTLVSISAGLVAEVSTAMTPLGLSAPFATSIALCVAGSLLIMRTWPQSHGDRCDLNIRPLGFGRLSSVIQSSRGAACLILVQAFFETAMYITLFMWTPTLTASATELYGIGTPPPYGIVFSLMMASLMLGSLVYQLITHEQSRSAESLSRIICLCAAASCLCLATVGANSHWVSLASLLSFEFCVGMYYPAIGFLRGKYVDRGSRLVVAQAAKTLLAVCVVALLMNFAEMTSLTFLICAVLLVCCFFVLQHASTVMKPAPILSY